MGLFGAIGNGLSGLFGEGFADAAARAGALVNGDYAGAARITESMDARKAAKQQAATLTAALRAKGLSDDDIAIVMANPGKFAEEYASRFQTRSIDEGSTVRTPNLDGSAAIFTAPKTFKEGADVMQTPAQNRMLPTPPAFGGHEDGDHLPGQSLEDANPYFDVSRGGGQPRNFAGLRTEAEQYADSIAQRGTSDWGSAVKDYTMKAYGPSAQAMLGDRLDTQRDIASMRNETTQRGQDLNDQRARRGQDMTDRRTRDGWTQNPGRGGKGSKPSPAAPVKVSSLEEARRLPRGTVFQTPDGRIKVR